MNLPDLFSAQFNNAFRYQQISNRIKVSGFAVNIILIFISLVFPNILETTAAISLILILSILILYFDFDYMTKSIKEHEKGEKIRKIHVLDFIFGSSIEDSELEYLLMDIEKWVKNKAQEKRDERDNKKGNIDSSTNFSTDETEQKAKIISHIQQNCFETSQYLSIYHKELNKKLKTVLIVSSAIVFLICIVLISLGFSRFSSSQLIIIAFNLLFTINIFGYINKCKEKSMQLKSLDQTLQKVKNTADFSDIIYFFSEYNSILVDKPSYPEKIYTQNNKAIEGRWQREHSKKKLII